MELYVREILKVRPNGPYAFFGVSIGGWIALETARALANLGHAVRMVAMYDTSGPGYPTFTPYGQFRKYIREHGGISFGKLRGIFRLDPGCPWTPRLMIWGAAQLLRNVRDTAKWWFDNTRRNWLYWRFEETNPPQGYSIPENLTRFRLASRRIVRRYQYRYYSGKITLFRARNQPSGAIYSATLGWEGMSSELEMHAVSGGHLGEVYSNAREFSERFRKCLER